MPYRQRYGLEGSQSKLAKMCEDNEFGVLLTTDRNLNSQQNISAYNIKVIVLIAVDNTLSKHELLIPSVKNLIRKIEGGVSNENYFEVRA